jgi:hypothetical protein
MVTALCPERGPEQPLRSASWFRAAVMTYWELHANTVSQSSLSESLRLILVISGSSISLRLPVYDSDLLQPECWPAWPCCTELVNLKLLFQVSSWH